MNNDELMSKIAHYEAARGISKNVPNMEGFLLFYVERLPTVEKEIILRYDSIRAQAHKLLAKGMEAPTDG